MTRDIALSRPYDFEVTVLTYIQEEVDMRPEECPKTNNVLRSIAGAAALAAAVGIGVVGTPQRASAANLSPGISVKFRPIAQLRSTASSSTASIANVVNITKHPALPTSLAGAAYNSWLTVADSRGLVSLVNAGSYTAGVTNPNRTIVDLRTATRASISATPPPATRSSASAGLNTILISPNRAPEATQKPTPCLVTRPRPERCQVPSS